MSTEGPETEWGHWLADGTWRRVQKKPIELAGLTVPCRVRLPSGKEVEIVERVIRNEEPNTCHE